MNDLTDLLGNIRNIQSLMVLVSTGRVDRKEKEVEYQEIRTRLRRYFSSLGITDPNPFSSLDDFYGYYRARLPSYQERREFIKGMYEKIEKVIESSLEKGGGININQASLTDSEAMLCRPIFKGRNFESKKNLCFILMPFRPNFDRLYKEHIKPTLEKAGFEALKADDLYTTSPIVEDIWEYINKARLVVADVTSRNPNVFYELGIAHTLGKDTVILTQNKEDIPFDLVHLRYFKYDDNEVGWKSLERDLAKIATSMRK